MDKLPSSVRFIYGYVRRSRQDVVREKKTNQDTLTEQRELIKDMLGRYDVESDIKEEIGSGGDTIEARPVFRALIARLKSIKPGAAALAVKEISRLGRGDYSQIGIVYDLLIEKQLFIVTPFKIYDPLDPEDQMALKFYMFIANIELDMTKRRLRESRYTYAKQGRWMTGGGGIPYGYRFNGYTQKLEPDPETSKVIVKIYDLYVRERLGYNGISTHMKKKAVPTASGKSYWHPMVIRRILINPVYKGTVTFKTTRTAGSKKIRRPENEWIVVPDAHPAIVDEAVWNKAQELIAINRGAPKVRLNFEPNPLASLIICGGCGSKMVRQSSVQHYTRKDGSVSTYHKEFMCCKACSVSLKYKAIEQEIIRILHENWLPLDPQRLERKLSELIRSEQLTYRVSEPAADLERLHKEIESLSGDLRKLRAHLRKELITEEEFKEDRQDMRLRLQERREQLSALHDEASLLPAEAGIEPDQLHGGLRSLYQLYVEGELSKAEKNELLLGICDYVVLEFVAKGRFNLTIALHAVLGLNPSVSGSTRD
jgi:site-specific DNA recombinase